MDALNTAQAHQVPTRLPLWQKFAWAGFVFFLLKGLLWLSAPAIFYLFA